MQEYINKRRALNIDLIMTASLLPLLRTVRFTTGISSARKRKTLTQLVSQARVFLDPI